MNKKRNYLKLSTLFFSLLLTMVFALAIPSTSKAAYLGKVTNLKQVAGEYFKDYGKYIIAVEYKQVAGAYGYVAELSTNNVSRTPVDEEYNSSADTFLIGTKTTLKPGTTYYIRITPIDSNYNFDSADTSDSLQVVTAPAAVSGTIKQTGAKSNSVSVSWNKATGATMISVFPLWFSAACHTECIHLSIYFSSLWAGITTDNDFDSFILLISLLSNVFCHPFIIQQLTFHCWFLW